jgi:FlaA1/EpsC-like NDP-sugar epimerase
MGPLEVPVFRIIVLLIVDALIATVSLWTAMLLRFEGKIDPEYWAVLPFYVLAIVAARLVVNTSFKLHRWSFRLSGLHDGARVVSAAVVGTGLFVLVLYLLHVLIPPRGVIVLEMFITAAGLVAVRFAPRLGLAYWMQINRYRHPGAKRTLIIGAGAAGEMLFRDLQRSDKHRFHIVGFIDDNKRILGTIVGGRAVLGGLKQLRDVIQQFRISTLLIAIPRSSAAVAREVVTICAGLDVQIKTLPVSYVYFQERNPASMLHDLSPEDLLSRQPVTFDAHERSTLAGRRVLVTGAAGSIGREICTQLLDLGAKQILAVDINENGLYLFHHRMRQRYKDQLDIAVVDIRDRGRVESIIQQFKPHDIFHAAAHTHVPLMESAPGEAVKNNVIGTSHLLHAAERLGVESFTFISTDKAVAPSSVMGATKRVGELMARAVAQRSKMFCCAVRFGNVLGSDGSVVPLFRQQIEAGGPITITDPDMHRYFMTIPEAVGLVLKTGYGRYGDLCVLDMGEPVRILDLAHQMIAMAGSMSNADVPIEFVGLRPGEKLNEELVMDEEEVTSRIEGKIQVIRGPVPAPNLWAMISELERAAANEDADLVVGILKKLVPTYRPSKTKPAVRSAHTA